MKQRIRVVGIVRRGRDFLLMKRVGGRLTDGAFWELPTGKINFGEQPEEAMSRMLLEFLGVYAEDIKLRDAITFVALEGASRLNNLYIVYDIKLKNDAKIISNMRYSAYKYVDMNGVKSLQVDEASLAVLGIEEEKVGMIYDRRGAMNGATVYVDGSSRGNPGPSGVGYYIVGVDGKVIERGGEYIGFATSRVAEYRALRLGILKAQELGLKTVRFVSDNLMMVNQINGIYRVKNADLKPLYREVNELIKKFDNFAIVHVKRTLNTEADLEANRAVSRHFERGVLK